MLDIGSFISYSEPMKRFILGSLLVFSLAQANEIICAGGDEVFILNAAAAEMGRIEKLWCWNAQEAADIPEEARRDFHHMDECKPIKNGAEILVCASNGGCALIDRTTKRVLWRAHARNAHSLAMLPRGHIVVASSLSGDHLEVFDLKGGATPIFKTPLHSAHGVVWDEQRQCLWALGFDELRAYTLSGARQEALTLQLKTSHKLPDTNGHDLRAVPGGQDLILTTAHGVYLFDRARAAFRPHPQLGAESKVKSADIHSAGGRILLGQWATSLRLFQPEGRVDFRGTARPYKARWMP